MKIGMPRALWTWALIPMLALTVCAEELVAQTAAASSPAPAAAEDSWPEVNVNVLVLDKSGMPQNVDQREFRLLEDGAERKVQLRNSGDSPASLAFVIDSSGSTVKSKDAIIAAVKALVKELPEDSEVMAVLFADQAFLDLPFTPASKVEFSFLDRLRAGGSTGLYDAVVATENHVIAHARYPRRALVILSDGEDNASRLPRGVAFRRMEQPNAPMVYACRLSKASLLIPNDSAVGHINMKFLAKEGGGIQLSLDPDPEFAAAQIAKFLRNQYVLQFSAGDPARSGKAHKIAVQLPIKDVQIHTQPVYVAPAK